MFQCGEGFKTVLPSHLLLISDGLLPSQHSRRGRARTANGAEEYHCRFQITTQQFIRRAPYFPAGPEYGHGATMQTTVPSSDRWILPLQFSTRYAAITDMSWWLFQPMRRILPFYSKAPISAGLRTIGYLQRSD